MNNKEQNVEIKIKEKKVYLTDNKNDMKQRQDFNMFQKETISSALRIYTGKNYSEKGLKMFIEYIEKNIKSTKSPNSFNIRVERLYNFIISKYSDYVEMIDFVKKGFNLNTDEQ